MIGIYKFTNITYTAFADIYHGYSWKNIDIDD